MKFDVIIGNPPYQIDTGNKGGNRSKAQSVYHNFISEGINLEPNYLSLITPSRWMTGTSAGISTKWIDEILTSKKFRVMHDFEEATKIFPDTPPEGGVNYFIWDKKYEGKCQVYYHELHNNEETIDKTTTYLDGKNLGFVIRDPKKLRVVDKIAKVEGSYYLHDNFSSLVSAKDFFTNKKYLTSSWSGFTREKTGKNNIKYYPNKRQHGVDYGYVSINDIPKNKDSIAINKVYIPAANGSAYQVLGYPFVGGKNSVCSQTYLVIGYDPREHNLSEIECENIVSYIKTKFFRYLVSIKKITQNGARGVYQLVPLQNFHNNSDIYWSENISDIDQQLYKKYNLKDEEIEIIEKNIKEME